MTNPIQVTDCYTVGSLAEELIRLTDLDYTAFLTPSDSKTQNGYKNAIVTELLT